MDVNFNPSTGFKRPHPGAQEEPHRAVRARPESTVGQECSTSGGGEPDAPLPAPGNLSAWEDSLPSFNFLPDTDWETPPASPTESVELSTILSELPGEPVQGRDTASAPPPASPITSGALSAMIRELQGQPEALQDATTSMFRQGTDAGQPAQAFTGEATGVDTAHQGSQSPLQNPWHRNLLAARQRLAAGAMSTATARELNIPQGTLANTFDRHGRLLFSNRAKALLQSRDATVARQTQRLPRALTRTDLDKLIQALGDNAGREPRQLLAALRNLPNPIAKEALAFLVDAGGLRADRLALLPDEQRQALEEAHQGRQSTLQNPLHRNLLAARQRLAAGATHAAAARELNMPKGTLTNTFNRHGHLMINIRGRRLLQSRDAQVARQVRQLPQALTPTDLNRLAQALRENAGREPSQLHTALQNLPNPVAKEALEFLVDAGGLRADRLALLPDEQRQLLEEARSVQDLI